MSQAEETFRLQCEAEGLPTPAREYRFAPPRRWRADFAWRWPGTRRCDTCKRARDRSIKLLVEIDGGAFSGGRHTRGKGFVNDIEKQNRAHMDGWAVLRFTPQMVEDGTAVAMVKEFLGWKS